MNFKDYLATQQEHINQSLASYLPNPEIGAKRMFKAMHHAVMNGGKRIRAVLVYATGEALGATKQALEPSACAVEFIHAYSLIHDDLPAMDNADLRRGQPSCHKAFDEATAILAGDALQSLAFQLLAEADMPVSDDIRRQMLITLSAACGPMGMAGGQALDMEAENKQLSLDELIEIHQCKTGALIRASVRLGALAAGITDNKVLLQLDDYASCIGLAFQIQDDILDVEADTETLGKPQGADIRNQKNTYPSLLGLELAKTRADELIKQALLAITSYGDKAEPLRALANYIIERRY